MPARSAQTLVQRQPAPMDLGLSDEASVRVGRRHPHRLRVSVCPESPHAALTGKAPRCAGVCGALEHLSSTKGVERELDATNLSLPASTNTLLVAWHTGRGRG